MGAAAQLLLFAPGVQAAAARFFTRPTVWCTALQAECSQTSDQPTAPIEPAAAAHPSHRRPLAAAARAAGAPAAGAAAGPLLSSSWTQAQLASALPGSCCCCPRTVCRDPQGTAQPWWQRPSPAAAARSRARGQGDATQGRVQVTQRRAGGQEAHVHSNSRQHALVQQPHSGTAIRQQGTCTGGASKPAQPHLQLPRVAAPPRAAGFVAKDAHLRGRQESRMQRSGPRVRLSVQHNVDLQVVAWHMRGLLKPGKGLAAAGGGGGDGSVTCLHRQGRQRRRIVFQNHKAVGAVAQALAVAALGAHGPRLGSPLLHRDNGGVQMITGPGSNAQTLQGASPRKGTTLMQGGPPWVAALQSARGELVFARRSEQRRGEGAPRRSGRTLDRAPLRRWQP